MKKLGAFWQYRKANRTTLIAIYSGSFVAGIGLAAVGLRAAWWWLAVSGALLFGCIRRPAIITVPLVFVAGIACGLWRGSVANDAMQVYRDFYGQKVTVVGTLLDDAPYGDRGQRDMRLGDVQLDGRSPPGQVRVTSFTLGQPRRGDVVRATGKLYDGFGSYQAAIYFADITLTPAPPNPADTARRAFAAGLYSNLPDTQASLGIGILAGVKAQLPDALNDQLKTLSLTHIVVASGYNLTVLVRLARRIFERRSKYQTVCVGAVLMAGFVMVTGFSASMSRAALVSGLSLAAWIYGRRVHPVVLLLFAAAITAACNPLYVWGDIGWWLSFTSFAGVMLLAPLLERKLYGKRRPKLIGQLVLETSAAQLATLPLMMALFGNVSVLGLIANMVVVPLVPLTMLAVFVAGCASFALGAAAAYVALPASWLLGYATNIIGALARVPWASVAVAVSPAVMAGLYAAMVVYGVVVWRKTGHDFLGRSVIE